MHSSIKLHYTNIERHCFNMENFKRRSGKCITILNYIIPTLNVIASTLKISRDVNSATTKLHGGILILRQKENRH